MIISDDAAVARLSSPMNLMNKLRSATSPKTSAMNLFGIGGDRKVEIKQIEKSEDKTVEQEVTISFNPFAKTQTPSSDNPPAIIPPTSQQEPNIDNLLNNSDTQIKLSIAHDRALSVMTDSLEALAAKLDDVKADKLPGVISATSKVVESIRRERNEAAKSGANRDVHYHFYTPIQKKVEDYGQVIEVS